MTLLVMALGLGICAGMRSMMPLVMISWAAWFGVQPLDHTALAFFGYTWSPWIFSLLATGELITDKLPNTPSRKVPMQFGFRVLSGTLAGTALGLANHATVAGIIGGCLGSVIGTLGGAWLRGKVAAIFGKDLPAALCEDISAIVLGLLCTGLLREI